MRRWIPDYTDAGISRERYQELLHFARQYPEWIRLADTLLGTSAQQYSQGSHGGGSVSDPTAQAVARREQYTDKINKVNEAANKAGPEWAGILLLNVCYGIPLYQIDPVRMPTSNRNAYFSAKKRFFILLHTICD